MKNIYIRVILFSLVQVIIYIAIYKIGWYFGSYFKGEPKNDLFWGLTTKYALFSFCIISLVGVYISEFLKSKISRIELSVFLISIILFSVLFIHNYSYTPFKTILLIISALSGLTVKGIISKKVDEQKTY
jgi:hypothetical protein